MQSELPASLLKGCANRRQIILSTSAVVVLEFAGAALRDL
jgi:hypothetical protein